MKQWFLGSIRGRGGYQAWMTYLAKGLQDPDFLLKFEAETDPWERPKLVGQKIRELRNGRPSQVLLNPAIRFFRHPSKRFIEWRSRQRPPIRADLAQAKHFAPSHP